MHRSEGFTLLEVLVAIVILSLGLLGLAGMMTNSLKSNTTSYYRTQATVMADDIMDRMRANLTLAQGGSYNVALGSSGAGSGIALTDVSEWKTNLSRELPAGDGSVTVDLYGNVTIVIQWSESGGTTGSFTTSARL